MSKKFFYPPAHRDAVVDNYHGTPVADPYRWLEDPQAPETQAWLEAQQRLTSARLASIPTRDPIKARLTALWNYPRYAIPHRAGTRYFFWKNTGLQPQDVLYRQATLDSEPVMVLDPNTCSPDGTVAVTNWAVSHDGTLLAYALSQRGSDWQTIKIRHVETGQDYAESLLWCRFTGIAWTHDNAGFFYNRFPEPGAVSEDEQYAWNRLDWHALSTPQADDPLVYERPDNRELRFSPRITDDGAYLVLHVWHHSSGPNRLYYRAVDSAGPFIRLLDEADAQYAFLGNVDTVFYFYTDLEAPRGRIIAIGLTQPARAQWHTVIPEHHDTLAFATMVNNQLAVVYMHDAYHCVKLYDLDGVFLHDIALPTIGSIVGLAGKHTEPDLFLAFQSFLHPTTIWRYHCPTGALTRLHAVEMPFELDAYETRQVFYTSKDGTRVPMFLTHKKGLIPNGHHPTLLYGYGGFLHSMTPFFAIAPLVWLEQGGIFAVACLRGGGEYGEAWHRAGMLEQKQNVFDDYSAAAGWLIDNNYTSAARLAIWGRSNGGLLVAACMLQRPELFGAVVCEVPVTDMLRYHKFTAGRLWVDEYGNAETTPEHFAFLYAYSPLHNITPGVVYPPTLITTADSDDRVVPSHALKFAAALQAADAGVNPIMLRMDKDAGHGLGKPTGKVIDELRDIYAFLFTVFDMGTREP
jgi:prolyl oligopeptidase